MKSGLIDKNGHRILCDYYKIESLCKKITEQYCLIDMKNNQKFIEFSQNYNHFAPYFDFVVGTLGYHLIHPWGKQDYLLCGNPENRYYILKKYNKKLEDFVPCQYGKAKIGFSSDLDLKIQKFFPQTKIDKAGFINDDELEMIPNVGGHRELARQIINLGMIKNFEVWETFSNMDLEHKDVAMILMDYFPLLRFEFNQTTSIYQTLYNSNNITENEKKIVETLERYGEIFCTPKEKNAPIMDWSSKFYDIKSDLSLNHKNI